MAVNPLHEVEGAQDHPTPVGMIDDATDNATDNAIDNAVDKTADGTADSAPHSPIEAALQSLIDLNGPALLFESDRLASDLRERCPDAEREISVLLRALDVQVPQDLLSAHTDEDLQSLLPRLAKQLSDRKRLATGASTWAVRTWARALGLSVFATGALPERLYADVVPSALDGRIPPRAWNAESDSGHGGEVGIARLDPKPPRWRPKALALWVTIGTTLVVLIAVIATGLASFRAPPREIPQVTSGKPVVGDGSKRNVGADIKDSAPLKKTVDSVAAPAAPPVIVAIAAPRTIVAGKPSTLTIVYAIGEGKIERIERKVIDGVEAFEPDATMTTRISELPSPKAGTVSYPLEALSAPSRSTIEFTLIDHDGARSAPKSIVLDVVGREPRQGSLDTVAQPVLASRVCTSATCGRVVAVRELGVGETIVGASSSGGSQNARREKTYEVTVLTDNGTTHLLTQAARWKKGARVRVIANTITAVNG